jgi:hypothetical protein
MKKTILVTLLWLLAWSAGAQTDSLYVDGKILVKIRDSESASFNDFNGNPKDLVPEIESLASTYGLTKISKPFTMAPDNVYQKNYLFEFSNNSLADDFVNDLQAISYVEYAVRVPFIRLSSVPDDPYFTGGNLSATNWHLKKINAESGWNINTGSSSIVIAVIDNEIDMTHPDLAGNLWTNSLDPPGNGDDDLNGITDDTNGADLADNDNNTSPNNILNHGTHCAGIAAAVTNNTLGISSIGYNCKLMPIKATSNSEIYPMSIDINAAINGIYYANSHGANVISCSWGMVGSYGPLSTACSTAIANNVVIVGAAGNFSSTTQVYPAAETGVIAVAATDINDQVASFSNYGSWIDVCAPGVSIFSTNSQQQITSIPGYDYKSGTSMATPLVAGLCGLILSQNPSLSPSGVQSCLTSTATNIDAINNPTYTGLLGAGRVNAPQAILCAYNNLNVYFTSDVSTACPGQTVNFTGYSVASGITSWNWTFSPLPASISGNGTANVSVTYTAPTAVSVTLTVVAPGGPYTANISNFLTYAGPGAVLASAAAGDLCDGSAQEMLINFQNATPPINYTISNGYVTQTVTGATQSASFFFNADINYPTYTITSISDASSCFSAPNSTISLNVVNCCANILGNGDFEQGNTIFLSDNTINCTSPALTIPQGQCSVTDLNPSIAPNNSCQLYGINGNTAQGRLIRNLALGIDARCGSNESGGFSILSPMGFNTPANSPGTTSRLWYEQNISITSGWTYNVDYFVASSWGTSNGLPFILRFEVVNQSTGNVIFTTTPNSTGYVANPDYEWHQFSAVWTSSVTATATVRLLQVDNFSNAYCDIAVDDISIRRTALPTHVGAAYAGPDVTICSGSSIQLSGSGTNTYSWSPGTGLSATNIAQPVATPTTTTTYTLAVSNTCGNSSDQVTVNVISAPSTPTTWTLSPTSPLCGPSVVTISVNPLAGSVVNWYTTSTGGTPFYTGDTYVTPVIGTTTTYYVSYQTGNCESSRAAITISVNPASCCVTPTITFTGSSTTSTAAGSITSGSIVRIPSNHVFTIDNNPSYTNVDFMMGGNARINVNALTTSSGANTLTLNNCRIYSDCGEEMWDGIFLLHNGTASANLTMSSGTSMEDAEYGIVANSGSTTVSAAITISNCVLNKNRYNMQLSNYTDPVNYYNLRMTGTILSCISSLNSPGNNLKTPYSTSRTYAGISLSNVRKSLIGSNTAFTNLNYFSDMDYGIYALNSGTEVTNNYFYSMAGNTVSSVPYGIAVYAPNTSASAGEIRVGGGGTYDRNVFTDVYRGIDATYAYSVESINNQMSCTTTPTSFTVTGNLTSQFGVRTVNINALVDVSGSSFNNFANAIAVRRNSTTSTTYNPPINIYSNTITTSGLGYVSNGIGVVDAAGNSITTSANIRIRNNSLSNIRDIGIQCQNILNHPVVAGITAGAQNIGMLYAGSGNIYGVYMANCLLSNVSNNSISSTLNGNTNLVGIYLKSSQKSLVKCNSISTMGTCIRAEGNCSSPYTTASTYAYGILSNTFGGSLGGISLVSSGNINVQGDLSHPAGNVWSGSASSYTSGQLFTDGASSPNNYYYGSGAGEQPTTLMSWSSTLVIPSTSGSSPSCPGSSVRMAGGTSTGEEKNTVITIAPNPNNGHFTVSAETSIDLAKIEIFTLQGKKLQVYEVRNFSSQQIDLSEFSSGLYYIHVSGSGVNETLKVIKD